MSMAGADTSPRDEFFQLLDRLLLLLDHRSHEVTDGDHAHRYAALDDRQVPDAPLGHDLHAMPDGLARAHRDDRRGHDLPDGGLGRRASQQDDLAGVVAL